MSGRPAKPEDEAARQEPTVQVDRDARSNWRDERQQIHPEGNANCSDAEGNTAGTKRGECGLVQFIPTGGTAAGVPPGPEDPQSSTQDNGIRQRGADESATSTHWAYDG